MRDRFSRGRAARLGLTIGTVILLIGSNARAQRVDSDINYDEARVAAYKLPDPLVFGDGSRVADASAWRARRRPEILRLFEQQMYGKAPGRLAGSTVEVTESNDRALGG